MDLVLVQDTGYSAIKKRYIWGKMHQENSATSYKGKTKTLEDELAGQKVWIVEAESDKKRLWEAIGQSFGYRAMFAMQYPRANVLGNVITYPENQGKDKMMEKAVTLMNKELVGVKLRIIPAPLMTPEREELKEPSGNMDLRSWTRVSESSHSRLESLSAQASFTLTLGVRFH
jgi:hypothetical protein